MLVRYFGLFTLAALVATAPYPDPGTQNQGQTCAVQTDCATGLICNTATNPSTCTPGTATGNGGTQTQGQTCAAQTDCATGLVCNTATNPSTCTPGTATGNGGTQTQGQTCAAQTDCATGLVCNTATNPSTCTPGTTTGNGGTQTQGQACAAQTDCATGLVCNTATNPSTCTPGTTTGAAATTSTTGTTAGTTNGTAATTTQLACTVIDTPGATVYLKLVNGGQVLTQCTGASCGLKAPAGLQNAVVGTSVTQLTSQQLFKISITNATAGQIQLTSADGTSYLTLMQVPLQNGGQGAFVDMEPASNQANQIWTLAVDTTAQVPCHLTLLAQSSGSILTPCQECSTYVTPNNQGTPFVAYSKVTPQNIPLAMVVVAAGQVGGPVS